MSHRVREKVAEVFGADLRSLAAFRVVLALLVLADLANRATDLSAHYADEGVLPRTALLDGVLDRWMFSLNLMNGEPLFQAFLFGVGALGAVGLLAGYRTRLMTVIVWVILLSIHRRNPLVLSAGDILLHILLFWGMFLPLGARWSVDRALKVMPAGLSARFLSLATVGLFMQIAFMYWFTAILKSGREWRVDGTALYYALSIDRYTTPIGAYLYQFPELLKALTFGTFALEAVGPFLLFFPIFTGPVRTAVVAAFMSLHLGIWLTMDIGIFPWISALCMVCFLPGWFWERVAAGPGTAFPRPPDIVSRVRRAGTRLIYDPRSFLGGLLSPVSSTERRPILGLALRGGYDRQWSHALNAIAHPVAGKAQREGARADVNKMGNGSPSPGPGVLKSSLATNVLAAFFLVYVFCWNLTTVSSFEMPERLAPIGPLLGLSQQWSMFAPYPARDDGWYVIPATLRDGRQVDLMVVTRDEFEPREVSWEKPRYVAGTFKNQHWRKYLDNIWEKKYADQRVHFGRYLCREWNARHSGAEQVVSFQIVYMLEKTLPDYRHTTPQGVVTWRHSCV